MPSRLRRGFTLIELILAAFVFAVGVLALEAMAMSSLRRMRRSATLSLASTTARNRLETLAAARCTDAIGGSDTLRSVVSTWTVAAAPVSSLRVLSQAVRYTVDGVERTDSYRTTFACSE